MAKENLLIDGMTPEKYKEYVKEKTRIETEAKAEVQKELSDELKEANKSLGVDYQALKARKPSPEEVIMKTHPLVKVRITSTEVAADDANPPPIEFTWGGVRQRFLQGQEAEIPYGLADHLKNECSYPIRTLRRNSDGTQEVVVEKRRRARFLVDPLDARAFFEAEEKVKEMGYVPIPERK